MTTKKFSVGIQFLSREKTGELVALLQVRAPWNTEKNSPESWPGVCQVTAHGGQEDGENCFQALLREVKEELGDEIAPIVQTLFKTGKAQELDNFDTPEKQIITYGAIVGDDVFETLLNKQKSSSFGGFKVIRRDEVNKIVDLQKFTRETGVTDENVIAMFPDGKQAVLLAFEKLG